MQSGRPCVFHAQRNLKYIWKDRSAALGMWDVGCALGCPVLRAAVRLSQCLLCAKGLLWGLVVNVDRHLFHLGIK